MEMPQAFSFGDGLINMTDAHSWESTYSHPAPHFLVSPVLSPKADHGMDAPFQHNEHFFLSFGFTNQFTFQPNEFQAFDDDAHFGDLSDAMFQHHGKSMS